MANLTQSQIDLLTGLVSAIRNKEIPEEVYVIWSVDGACLHFEGAKSFLSAPSITKPKLEVLAQHGLIHSHVEYETEISEFAGTQTHTQRESIRIISITQKGYDFVDNPSKRNVMEDSKSGSVSIEYFQGILGNVHGNVSQNLSMTIKKGDFETLAAFLREKQIEESDIANLKDAITADSASPNDGKFGERTATWIADLTKKSLMGTLKLGRDVGVAVIAQKISQFYGFSH